MTTSTTSWPVVLESIDALESYAASLEARHAGHLAEMGRALRDSRERYAATRTVGSIVRGKSQGLGRDDNHYTRNVRDSERYSAPGKKKTLADHRADYLEILERATPKERDTMDPRDTTMLANHHIARELRHLADTQRAMLAVIESDDWAADETERDNARSTLKRAGREAQEMLAKLAEADPLSNEADGAESVDVYDDKVKVIGYARVSTQDQGDNGASLDAQEHEIRAYAERKGWALEMVHEVASGTTMRKRPVMRAVLDRLAAGEAQALVVTKLDRLSRSVPDAVLTLNRAGEEGWDLVLMDMGMDTTTASGRAMFGMMAVFAQLYRDQISENTKAALRQKRREGVILGRPKATGPAAEAAIARLTELRASGLSLQAVSDALNDEGVPGLQGGQWFKQSVHAACKRYGI